MSSRQFVPSSLGFHKSLNLILVFFVGSGFIIFLYGGLVFGFIADYPANLAAIQRTSYTHLIVNTFNPLTPAWFFMDNIIELRPLGFIFMKLWTDLFGASVWPPMISESVACGLLASLIFFLIHHGTRSFLYAWLGVFLYLSLPTNFFAFVIYPRMECLLSLLRLSAVVLFGYIAFRKLATYKFLGSCLGFYLLTLFAIKLKSSEKVLPLLFLLFLAMRFRPICAQIGKKRLLVLLAICCFMTISIVPSSYFTGNFLPKGPVVSGAATKESNISRFSGKNLYAALISRSGDSFALFRSRSPESFTESLGFFLGWAFWAFLVLSAFFIPALKRGLREDEREQFRFVEHFLWLFLLWAFFMALGLGTSFSYHELRYMNYLFLPAVPLLFFLAAIVDNRITLFMPNSSNR